MNQLSTRLTSLRPPKLQLTFVAAGALPPLAISPSPPLAHSEIHHSLTSAGKQNTERRQTSVVFFMGICTHFGSIHFQIPD